MNIDIVLKTMEDMLVEIKKNPPPFIDFAKIIETQINILSFFGLYDNKILSDQIHIKNILTISKSFIYGNDSLESWRTGVKHQLDKLANAHLDDPDPTEIPDWHGDETLPEDLYSISNKFSQLSKTASINTIEEVISFLKNIFNDLAEQFNKAHDENNEQLADDIYRNKVKTNLKEGLKLLGLFDDKDPQISKADKTELLILINIFKRYLFAQRHQSSEKTIDQWQRDIIIPLQSLMHRHPEFGIETKGPDWHGDNILSEDFYSSSSLKEPMKNNLLKLSEEFEAHTKPTIIPGLNDKKPIKEDEPISQDSRPRVDKNGIKRYYNSFGKLHRVDGPAVINPDGTQLWFQWGKLHREDGPAAIFFNGTQKWYLEGNEIGPVEILQLLLNQSIISIQDIETLKELAEIAFFDYAKLDVNAIKQAGTLLQERGVIQSRNMHSIVQFMKAAQKL